MRVFKGESRIINDKVGSTSLVLIGDAATRTVRAYERGDRVFESGNGKLTSNGQNWQMEEDFLIGPNQEKLRRVPGHIAFWFAWDGYLGIKSELYAR